MNDLSDPAASIGHNQPPMTLAEMLDPEQLRKQLLTKYAGHTNRVKALIAGAARFCLLHHSDRAKGPGVPDDPSRGEHYHVIAPSDSSDPGMLVVWNGNEWTDIPDMEVIQRLLPSVIVNDELLAAKVTTLVLQLKETIKKIETDRKTEKTVFDSAGKAVQAVMKDTMIDPLDTVARKVQDGPLNDYQRRKDEAERLRREAEAARLKEEAEKAAAAAQATMNADLIDNAIETAAQAQKADRVANAGVADRARVVGAMGGVAAAQKVWKFRVVDVSKIPDEFFLLDEQRLGQIARTEKEKASVPGVEFYSETKTNVRG